MKQIIFRLLVTAIIVAVLIQTGTINALFMLFVAGSVPGTDYVIPANTMMLAYCTIICAVLLYTTARNIIRDIFNRYVHASSDSNKPSPSTL